MILIMIFSIIHLGVGGGIISTYRYYGALFNAERGLAGFNVFIGVVGFLIGILGLFTVLSSRTILNRIIWIASCVLGVLCLIALIAALALNSQAIEHASSSFQASMSRYSVDRNARTIVDRIQTSYECCGENTWLDWYGRSLEQPPPLVAETVVTFPTSTISTTTASPSTSETTSTTPERASGAPTTMSTWLALPALTSSSTSPPWNPAFIVDSSTDANDQSTNQIGWNPVVNTNDGSPRQLGSGQFYALPASANNPLLINKIPDASAWFAANPQSPSGPGVRRKRRQVLGTANTYGLPTSYSIPLPPSCCTTDFRNATDPNTLLCVPIYLGDKTNFHSESCSKTLSKMAISQTLGLVVINSILMILAFLTIPIVKNMYTANIRSHKTYRHDSTYSAQLPHEYEGAAVIEKPKHLSVSNQNTDYSVHQ